jgi:hypothetical protein
LVFSILSFLVFIIGCIPIEDPIKFPKGTFPNSVMNITDINSEYDDYNMSLPTLFGNSQIIFSSNRRSTGGQFDLEQANIYFEFDKTNGNFSLITGMTDDAFLDRLISKAKTPGNDFGPYRLYSSLDEFEYLLLSSVNSMGNLDLFYLKNRPAYNSGLPEVDGPYPIKLFNTNSDDAYICFDSDLDSAFFVTNKDGNFDIFLQKRPADKDIASWFNLDYAISTKVDFVNSSSDDKCPQVFRKIMVFASNRPGGLGGFDLYSSVFRNGKWSSPVNLGPGINTSSDEYRPVIGYHPDFTNLFMMFSSNRPGGKGGFDLYFTGVEFPEK